MAKKRKLKKPNIDFSKFGLIFKYNLTKFIIPFVLVMAIGILVFAFVEGFKVKKVTVEGSMHYTTDEITNYVLDSKFCRNTIFLKLKYKNKSIEDIPFVEQIDVKIVDRNTVKITVYEKYVAGCVSNLGNYMYFDNEGNIVEVSKLKTENIPVVTGLEFDHFTLYEPLPIENKEAFNSILTITKLLNKNSLNADIIFFDENMNITLFFDDVRVNIGTGENMDEKFMTLPMILPSLEGQKGVLHMENYSKNNANVVFNIDESEIPVKEENLTDTPGITLVY
ncbi:MAG: FtsQ-type POTRA domain-containing protein [Lachnospiraceae bacterium]|nr:FtsQ-type POTRA domain-containing protein [Lachnospiraceae bacterium]